MEDILASIRRIIADDQSQGGRGYGAARRGAAPSVAVPEAHEPPLVEHRHAFEEVLDLARMPETVVPEGPRQHETAADESRQGDASHDDHADAPEAAIPETSAVHVNGDARSSVTDTPALPEGAQAAVQPVSGQATPMSTALRHLQQGATASEDLMSPELGASVMSSFETLAATVVLQNNDMLDRVMRDLLRPLLKTWLDENLPGLVERLVRVEIERMARGGRG